MDVLSFVSEECSFGYQLGLGMSYIMSHLTSLFVRGGKIVMSIMNQPI